MRAGTRFSLIVAFATALLAAGTGNAQTTNCGWVLGRWTCETQQQGNVFGGLQSPGNVGQSIMDSYYRGAQQRQMRERADLERQRLIAEREAWEASRAAAAQPPAPAPQTFQIQEQFVATLEQRQQIGEMLKANDCAGAINRALELGDIQLATNTKAFCGGATVQTRP